MAKVFRGMIGIEGNEPGARSSKTQEAIIIYRSVIILQKALAG
jgi:hypothetical protein